ncbi:UDP-N-acetylmuramoyl-L-alanine--D-glutamate ligase [Parashewanella spongiae]|uniref:UDP-N-acetylmuramoylalanine--D-glutamate ligase n=1 Tax=Parashewanella spongiae TaxID=342950 RepID=A0A3A6U261_9GAMM|nr:UDP-N-acetylmuramoyl-L-alanine--D-glutamate ligase [Parashewanella spongiae]MCL1078909.1 UDP-N-acetylmuramoyl-L-alanine--D-glutamate ligase [Parashewanella spongiae]RJY11437.1 UDP-N-acetylmuramoyl-L-alanine--D-glutamate ligase [Parashewanella spongiae]
MQEAYTHIVLGLGVTGLSVVRYFSRQGIRPLVMDSRPKPAGADVLAEEFPDITLICGSFDVRYLVQAQQIIISPGIALNTAEVKAAADIGIEIIGDVELFARELINQPPKVIGITGSNGKSTVTTLVGEMAKQAGLKVSVGGNIGIPVLDLLHNDVGLYVLELSSFQLETTASLKCVASTCLNVTADHMDRYESLQAYRRAKLRLYDQSKLVVINREDELTQPLQPKNQISFGLNVPESDDWGIRNGAFVHGNSTLLSVNEAAAVGLHNQANILAAMALADAAGIKTEAMNEVVKMFMGLPHRCEKVAEKNGITYINDSKATNVGATLAAINGLREQLGEIILIAGGDAKGADLSPLIAGLEFVKKVIVFGKDAQQLAKLKDDTIRVENMAQAVTISAKEAETGDIVLLSPACASLDMYKSFAERGDDFKLQVEALHGF